MALDSVDWGGPVLSLLSRFDEIDDDGPLVLILRHSEVRYQNIEDLLTTNVTELGLKVANEVGTLLPSARKYRIYHTFIPRSRQTAEEITEGLRSVRRSVAFKGECSNMSLTMEDDVAHAIWSYPDGSWFLMDWLSHRLSPDLFMNSLDLAMLAAKEVCTRLEDAEPGGVDIHVSHGEMVALFKFYWLGLAPVRGTYGFLNGFILQPGENEMTLYTSDGVRQVKYPHWWDF
jgi:broad specificity phosphatase PhoE